MKRFLFPYLNLLFLLCPFILFMQHVHAQCSITPAPSSTICAGTSATLTASGGTNYVWSTGETATSIVVSPTAAATTYTLDVDAGTCTASATINVAPNPTVTAGPDQTGAATCGTTTVTLAGSAPPSAGVWTAISGDGLGNFSNANSATSGFNGTAGQTYSLVWTVTDGTCSSSDTVNIKFNINPTVANAGSDQTDSTTCGLTTIKLVGNNPSIGTGTWTEIAGDGLGNFTNIHLATSDFSGTAGQAYILKWTITNGVCSSNDNVNITFNISPTAANAGPDQTNAATCGLTSVTLAANTPTVGTGAWSIVNGTGGSFGNASSPTSSFSGTAGNAYTLRWTTTNGICKLSDDVNITFNVNPTTANAGTDQTICSSTATLAGNNPTTGTGMWSLISGGGTITAPSNFNSGITALASGVTSVFRWTITNGVCVSSDDVNINNGTLPVVNAGADQTLCAATTATLSANTPGSGSGAWSVIAGGATVNSPSSPNSTVSNLSTGINTFRWTITNGICVASDDITINVDAMPTAANAGADQTGASTCGLTSVTLAAVAPSVGTGMWSILTGTGGSFGNSSAPNSLFSGTAGNSYSLEWTTTNGSCSTTDTMNVTFNQNPTTANAGADQIGASTCGTTTVTLAGNSPSLGSGTWLEVSGDGMGVFGNSASPTSSFTGTPGIAYTLRWVIANGVCTTFDDVNITLNSNPTIANAGTDSILLCDSTSITMYANNPVIGSGSWSVISGTGVFGNVNSPVSKVTGLSVGANIFRWTISNSPCADSFDDITVSTSLCPNFPPSVNDTSITTSEDTAITVCIPISDLDTGEVYTASLCGVLHGNAIANVTAKQLCVTYTPNMNYNGKDTVCIVVCDNGIPSLCDTTHIAVTVTPVNDAPVVNDTTVTMPEDSTINICLPISDPDAGETFSAVLCGVTNGGAAVSVTGNQVCVIINPSLHYYGQDTVCVIVCDNGTPALCDTAHIFVTITPMNHAPVVSDTTVTMPEDSVITVCVPIADIDTGSNFQGSLCGVKNGTANISVVGIFACVTYTPNTLFYGQDTVCIIVCDNGTPQLCDTAHVAITITPVNHPPVVADTSVTTPEDIPITVCLPISDIDTGESFSASLCGATSGTATVSINGSNACITFTPSLNFIGVGNVCIVVCDNGNPAKCDTAHISITVSPVNHPPVVPDSTVATPENNSITWCTTISDMESSSETFSATLCGTTNGTATVTVSGTQLCVTFLPSENFFGSGNVCVILCDDGNPVLCDTINFTIIVSEEPLKVPDAFSPNGDNVNDLFVIPGIENYPQNKITVLNRWGNLVYDASPYKNDWDGTAHHGITIGGEKLPTGTYFVILDLNQDGLKPIKKYIYISR